MKKEQSNKLTDERVLHLYNTYDVPLSICLSIQEAYDKSQKYDREREHKYESESN